MADKFVIAASAAEAAALRDGDSAFLAGGTEINRLGSSVDAGTLISIGRIAELDGVSIQEDCVRIGAMCTFQDIVENKDVPQFLKDACLFMGSRTKRNMATIGGNVALGRTDSYLCATLLACHAGIILRDAEGTSIRRCVKGYLEDRAQYSDMLIEALLIPGDAVVVSKRYSNTVQSHAVLTVSAGISGGLLRIAVAARDTYLGLLPEISTAIAGAEKPLSDEAILKLINGCPQLAFRQDMFGSPEYKRYLLAVTIADLVAKVRGGEA